MARHWRWSAVVLVATAVLGSFIPSSMAAAGDDFLHAPAAVVGGIITIPSPCFIPSCGKGSPAPSAPTVAITGVAALLAIAGAGVASRYSRRARRNVAALPRGTAILLFHPPQFS
jgi:hypothetical protein